MRARTVLIAASMSNLWLAKVWVVLLTPSVARKQLYYIDRLPTPETYLACLALFGIITAVGSVVLAVLDRGRHGRLLACCLAIGLSLGMNALRQVSPISFATLSQYLGGGRITIGLGLAAAIVVAWLTHRHHAAVRRAAEGTLLAFFPFAILTVGQTVGIWARHREISAELEDRVSTRTEQAPTRVNGRAQVVLVVFDTFDGSYLADDSPILGSLPALRRLMAESLVGTNAFPAGNATSISMPSLIVGRVLVDVRPENRDAILVFGNSNQRISESVTLFTEIRQRGLRTGLVGWYNPYCRIIGHHLDACEWFSAYPELESAQQAPALVAASLLDALPGGVQLGLAERAGLSRRVVERGRGGWGTATHTKQYVRLHNRALSALRARDSDLLLLHYPVPHGPVIYDSRTADFALDGGSPLGNFSLADRTLGEIREAIETSGAWQDTTLIVTADHTGSRRQGNGQFEPLDLRKPQHRVPLIVRIPNAGEPAVTGALIRTPALVALSKRALLEPQLTYAEATSLLAGWDGR